MPDEFNCEILVVESWYPKVLEQIDSLITINESISLSFNDLRKKVLSLGFGTGGIFEYYFNKFGVKTVETVFNSSLLAKSWICEAKTRTHLSTIEKLRFSSMTNSLRWRGIKWSVYQRVLEQQILELKPKIVLVKNPNIISMRLKKTLQSIGSQIVLHHSSTLPSASDLVRFDTIISSLPSVLQFAQKLELKTIEFFPGYDVRNDKYISLRKSREFVFVGSLHGEAPALLEVASRVIPSMHFFGFVNGHESSVMQNRTLWSHYKGEAWGGEMKTILGESLATLNRHSLKNFFGNLRSFESTGLGAALFSDGENAHKHFFDSDELVLYKDLFDLESKLQKIISEPEALSDIGRRGRERTLAQHTYDHRIPNLLSQLL